MWNLIVRLFKFYIVSAVVFLGLFYFTALPLQLLRDMVAKNAGLEVRGLQGNLYKGVKINSVRKKGSTVDWNLSEISFQAGAMPELLKGRLVIENLSAKQLEFTFHEQDQTTIDLQAEAQSKKSSLWKKLAALVSVGELRINGITIQGIGVKPAGTEPIAAGGLEAKQLRLALSHISLEEARFFSPICDFKILASGIRDSDGVLRVRPRIDGKVKATASKLLKADLAVKGEGLLEDSGHFELNLSAFENQVKVSTDPSGAIRIIAENWEPSSSIQGDVPMKKVNFVAEISEKPTVSMNFEIGKSQFSGSLSGELYLARHLFPQNDGEIFARLDPKALLAGQSWIEVKSTKHSSLNDIVAYLHYGKEFIHLTPADKASIVGALSPFKLAMPGSW
jgi:hypothetical protein